MKKVFEWFKQLFKREVKQIEVKDHIYYEYTYRTELQIVQRNQQVICNDFIDTGSYSSKPDDKDRLSYDPVVNFINRSFNQSVMHLYDKSNKYYTSIVTSDIVKILYLKPKVTVETKKVKV